jgi:Lon-like protease
VASYRYDDDPAPRRRSLAGGWVLWGLIAIVSIVVIGSSFVPSDYVIEQPGTATPDVLGTIDIDGSPVSLIDIPAQTTYPTTGSLHMLTVSTFGNRERQPSWFQVFQAWIDPTQKIVPVDEAFPNGLTTEESLDQSAAQMSQSQQSAIAAALTASGYDYTTTVSVGALADGGPSSDLLEVGDVITAINTAPVDNPVDLRALIAESGTEKPLTVTVTRAGQPLDLVVTPVLSTTDDPQPVIGIEATTNFIFPFEVSIEQGDIGGPSAGQIFALGIIDKLTPGALVGDLSVAGTGTITPSGQIGRIGGITQKLYGAERAGAHVFLAPASNCADIAAGSVPADMDIYAVSTLADSIYVLNTLTSGASSSMLPRCPVN